MIVECYHRPPMAVGTVNGSMDRGSVFAADDMRRIASRASPKLLYINESDKSA